MSEILTNENPLPNSSVTPAETKADADAPPVKLTRYQQVANTLLAEIEGGQHKIGALLPTEHELCERFGVSRYTVREALRRLFEAGLVARRRGAGTTVIALKRPPLFDLAVSSVTDIFNYAKNTQFEIKDICKARPDKTLVEELDLQTTESWSEILGLRFSDMDPRPVGLTRLYVNTSLEKVSNRLNQPYHLVRDFTDIAFEIPVIKMEQSIRAAAIGEADARLLRVETGSVALRVIRRFLAADGVVIQIADNYHPSDRFSLSMTFENGNN